MKVAIIGANGQLGSAIVEQLRINHQVCEWNHGLIDVGDESSVNRMMELEKPDWVINTAAYHVVPDAEKKPQMAFAVNSIGPLYLARACSEFSAGLVHFSTDYVFDGMKGTPYVETDMAAPLNVYGASKLAGQQMFRWVSEL